MNVNSSEAEEASPVEVTVRQLGRLVAFQVRKKTRLNVTKQTWIVDPDSAARG